MCSGTIAGVNWVATDHERRNDTKKSVCKYVVLLYRYHNFIIIFATVCPLEAVNLLQKTELLLKPLERYHNKCMYTKLNHNYKLSNKDSIARGCFSSS